MRSGLWEPSLVQPPMGVGSLQRGILSDEVPRRSTIPVHRRRIGANVEQDSHHCRRVARRHGLVQCAPSISSQHVDGGTQNTPGMFCRTPAVGLVLLRHNMAEHRRRGGCRPRSHRRIAGRPAQGRPPILCQDPKDAVRKLAQIRLEIRRRRAVHDRLPEQVLLRFGARRRRGRRPPAHRHPGRARSRLLPGRGLFREIVADVPLPSLVARIGMETEFPLSPSGSVRRCVRTQAVRARSLCSGLFGRVGSP